MDLDRALDVFANDSKSLRHSREDLLGDARLVFSQGQAPLSGVLMNLSAGGVGVKLARDAAPDVKKGESVHLEVHFSDGESFEVQASVAWKEDASADGRLFGLVFHALDAGTEDIIHRRLIEQVVSRHIDDEDA